MKLRKNLSYLQKNLHIVLIIIAVIFVLGASFTKIVFTDPSEVYLKIRLGQGLWWASTAKPSLWYIKALQSVNNKSSFLNRKDAEILEVKYYPWWGSDEYDVYVTLKLNTNKKGNPPQYLYNRTALEIGAPIEFEFPQVQFGGTIVELSDQPFTKSLKEKRVTLEKHLAYPWEADSIIIGDYLHNGIEKVFVVEDIKKEYINAVTIPSVSNTNVSPNTAQRYINLIVAAKIKVEEINNQLIFAETQRLVKGKKINISTGGFTFQDFIIRDIED